MLEEFVAKNDMWLTYATATLFEENHERNDGEKCFDLAVFREYLRLDKALHIHKSRRRNVYDEYDFGEGKVRITVDYDCRNVLTGEAAYTVEPVE